MTEAEPRSEQPKKLIDELYRFRGTWDKGEDGVFWLRIFERPDASPVIVLAELDANESTSVTNLAEILAAEVIAKYMPHRFEYDEPALILEHYPQHDSPRGRIEHEATWDRVVFDSWSPRRVWLGGQERVSLGSPEWRSMPRHEVADLISQEEMIAVPPPVFPNNPR